MRRTPGALLLVAVHSLAAGAAAQAAPADADSTPPAEAPRRAAPVLEALPVTGAEPAIDGILDDAAWSGADVADGFVQFEPDEGDPATQGSEARVLYGSDALFVAFRAWDSAPDSIAGQLTRRDQSSYSDQVAVLIDSYFDRRTAFEFAVNPVGVKNDIYRYDDTNEDWNWDAVWDVATSIDEEGWSAEFRIPYSQLRFRESDDQTWGINFRRHIARHQETSVWSPTLRSESAIVSRFGELRNLKELRPPRRLELQPYTLARVERSPGSEADPFWSKNAFTTTVGGDLKYGLTSNLTLDVTINPDFGQVEADPSQVNLSAYETFLNERRPFFVEGRNLFSSGGGGDALFYSRRVGRAPQGSADAGDDGHVDRPAQTTILGAMKVSGKTADGWSIGILDAVTSEEQATVAPRVGEHEEVPVEPLSNYLVARVARDFREGRSAVGAIATAVIRDRSVSDALGIRPRAFAGGLDARHRFAQDRWELRGYGLGSHVAGSPEAILSAQRSSARYFQRPDNEHTELDSTRTALSGASAGVNLNKIAGGSWRFGTGFDARSPGFETNDLGFMGEADYLSSFLYLGYDQSSPQGIFRRWRLNLNSWSSWSFGGEHYNIGGNVNGNFQLENFWGGYAGINYNAGGLSSGFLRGGPAFRTESNLNGWAGLNSDSRKPVQLNLESWWNRRAASGSWNWGVFNNVSWRPSGRATVSLGGTFERNLNHAQWIRRITEEADTTYLFGRLDQSTVSLTARLDFAFTPTLSLQLYAAPFVSAGAYGEFKRAADFRADEYADRFAPVSPRLADGEYFLDTNGDGTESSFDDPDFNVRQFHSNAVLRWEYQPGSTIFLVWGQGRDGSADSGRFRVADDMRDLFEVHPRNVFMLKVSYWLNP